MNLGRFYGFVFTAAVFTGPGAVGTSSSRSGEDQPDNFIGLISAPDRVADGSLVHVRYLCSGPCGLTVEVLVSTLRKTDVVVFRRRWISITPRVFRIQQVLLRFSPSILYRRDFFNRRVVDVQSVAVRGWLDHLNGGKEPGTYYESTLRIYKVLQVDPVSERPAKPPTECPSWSAQLIWQITKTRIRRCPHESDVVDMLTFPLASPGDHFGVVRRFQPFIDRDLENARLQAVTQPSVTVSVWIYLLRWCHDSLCGILHHLGGDNQYESVLMQLTDSGSVVVQAQVTSGPDKAFRAGVVLPQRKWIRLDCSIQKSTVLLDATWDDETSSHVLDFQDTIRYDDTDGYFVIGGSRHMAGIYGYFGPIRYYRLGTGQVTNHPQPMFQLLDEAHQDCDEMRGLTWSFLREATKGPVQSAAPPGFCSPPLLVLGGRSRSNLCIQTWSWEQQLKHTTLFHFLQTRDEIRAGSLGMKDIRTALFQEALGSMFTSQNQISSRSTALLRAASCFQHHQASLLLAAVHLSGLGGAPVDQLQGHVYSLIGALGGNRFALMHAGYKHTQGLDGFPEDLDVAYSYYSNAGTQSVFDSNRMHEKQQHSVEHVYLNNPEDLNNLIHETSDVFQFLKYRAERGDLDSQRRLGTLLYWGQHGVSKDIVRAAKWLERSALQMKDPSALYDYSLLLMKGEGVKRNYSRGLELMEKAAAMGSVEALNGLGWYHGRIRRHRTALKYFEQAALNGSADGMFNLGLYHLNGQNPDAPGRNQTAAFLLFLNASRLGHVVASVEAAWYLSTGSLGGASQDVGRAVRMLKTVCDRNGHLGSMTRDALQDFLRGARRAALLKYVLAAEAGLGLAQSNAAHLCQELDVGGDCQWRYHNYSVLNYDPHPSALLRMGDHYYYSSSSSWTGEAVSMYGRAAAAGSPQGMFNLFVLGQRGHQLPSSVLALLNVSHDGEQDVLVKILQRCVETEGEDAVTPCSVALLVVQMRTALRTMSHSRAQLFLMFASLLSVAVMMVGVPLQNRLDLNPEPSPRGPRGSALRAAHQHGVSFNRGQDGAAGRSRGAAGNPALRRACDVAVTLAGVCLCAFWTALLHQLL